VPSLQLDVAASLDVAAKRALARALGAAYAEIMDAAPELVTVVVRDLGEGGVWRCTAGEPEPGALLMCDVRAGRDAATRDALARRLAALCAEHAGVDPATLKVEFTQHPGDDMWHPHLGGFNADWSPEADPGAPPA
jgi:phenylpyruvate tautomerase PptA (4-oxalocrotonate tautomerase family)